ncbi:hypothetical protein CHS0354_034383 [Potamilus streckersoni]|uniref:Sulfotransferase domain-containing protein n=1 Tax=Potamilus streckersoni TaxID=2493646 RepID=A0AAE0WEZ7_9BIVA|nr:hypothetical protein CHS0354_034383 [Potamilus streckersoni]
MTDKDTMQATPDWSVIKDGAGREFRVLNIGKRHWSDVSIKLFIPDGDVLARRERVLNMTINEDDVVLLTYPKSDLGQYWYYYVTEVEKFCKENLDYPILNLKYEEIKKNQHKEINRLAEFLEIDASASLVADIINKCDISNLKTVRGDTKDGGKPFMYRKGTVSDWKNWLTVAENEAFDKVYQEKMAESDLKFEY